jgi:hypothetical protein
LNLYCAHPVIDAEIERMLGPTVAELLRDPHVQDILANHDTDIDAGIVFVDYGSGPRCATGTRIRSSAIKAVTRLLATVHGQSLDPFAPSLTCDLACGARYHGVLSPGTDGPSFSIRTHQRIIRPLSDFASPEQAQFIEDAVIGGKNIVVAGATSSGKTTLLNAMIALIPIEERPEDLDPILLGSKMWVDVHITRFLKEPAPNTYRIDWEEITHQNSSATVTNKNWSATLGIATTIPSSQKTARNASADLNPLGLYVTTLSWAPEAAQ